MFAANKVISNCSAGKDYVGTVTNFQSQQNSTAVAAMQQAEEQSSKLASLHSEFNDVWQGYQQRLPRGPDGASIVDLNKVATLMFFLGFGAAKNEIKEQV